MKRFSIVLVSLLQLVSTLSCSRDETVEASHDGGHDAEPEHDAADDHAAEVRLNAHVIERNGIRTEAAQRRLLLGALEVPAEVQVNPDRTVHVASLAFGQLIEINATLGDYVKAGDVLATVRSVELGRLRAELTEARARKRAADSEYSRAKTLASEGISAKKAAIEARARAKSAAADVSAAQTSLAVFGSKRKGGAEFFLRSSITGQVIERHASPGEVVSSASTPFVIADLSEVWVIGRVYEQELAQVSKGMLAEVALIAYPGRTWSGDVDYVSSTLDEDTRTVAVRVVLDNRDGLLRPGMFGTIAVANTDSTTKQGGTEVLSVPDTAIVTLGDRTVVFVTGDDPEAFLARDVVPGARAHGFVEIREGLAEGIPVVTHGAFVLKSELLKSSIGEGHEH